MPAVVPVVDFLGELFLAPQAHLPLATAGAADLIQNPEVQLLAERAVLVSLF
jgi:hypothetical protein